MNKQQLIDALQWQLDAGVDLTFGDEAVPMQKKKVVTTQKQAIAENKATNVPANDFPNNSSNNNYVASARKPEKSSFDSFKENMDVANKYAEKTLNAVDQKEVNELISEAEKLASEAKTLDELREKVESFDGLSIKALAKNCGVLVNSFNIFFANNSFLRR